MQFTPVLGAPERNRATASALIDKKVPKHGVAAILLPEMAFSGYQFASRDEILPFCELAEEHSPENPVGSPNCTCGETVRWALSVSQQYNAAVQVGFPRRVSISPQADLYNSVCLVQPSGACTIYDKTHLYYTDESWAKEGAGFKITRAPMGGKDRRIGTCICMDLNPYRFEAPWDDFECGSFYAANKAELLFGSMAWCTTPEGLIQELKACTAGSSGESSDEDSESESASDDEDDDDSVHSTASPTNEDKEEDSADTSTQSKPPPPPIDPSAEPNHGPWPAEGITLPSYSTLNYWVARLSPLEKCTVLVANRTGTERGTTFLGTSCAIHFTGARPVLLGALGRGEQNVLLVDVR